MSKKLTSQEVFTAFPKREEGKLNIYFHVSENSGVGYYRQYLPASKIQEHGLANVLISDVIEPSCTRYKVAIALHNTLSKRATPPPKKHGNMPL